MRACIRYIGTVRMARAKGLGATPMPSGLHASAYWRSTQLMFCQECRAAHLWLSHKLPHCGAGGHELDAQDVAICCLRRQQQGSHLEDQGVLPTSISMGSVLKEVAGHTLVVEEDSPHRPAACRVCAGDMQRVRWFVGVG